MERVVKNPLMFTNEDIEKLIATCSEEYHRAYEEMINGKDTEDETDIE